MPRVISLIALCIALFSCKDQSESGVTQFPKSDNERITIVINQSDGVQVDTETDSIQAYGRVIADSVFGEPRENRIENFLAIKSGPLCDSISWYANQILRDTATVNDEVSCYGGEYLRIVISKGSAKYSASFNSVSNWKNGSTNARELARLLSRNKLLVE